MKFFVETHFFLDFGNDVKAIEPAFLRAGYPKRFICHTVFSFLKDPPEDDNLIPNSKSATKFSLRFLKAGFH